MIPIPRVGYFVVRNAGVLLLGRGHICHMSYCENELFLLKSSPPLQSMAQTNEVYTIDEQGRVYENCKFHFRPGHGFLCLGMVTF